MPKIHLHEENHLILSIRKPVDGGIVRNQLKETFPTITENKLAANKKKANRFLIPLHTHSKSEEK